MERGSVSRIVGWGTVVLVVAVAFPTAAFAQIGELESGGDEFSVPLPDRLCRGVHATGQSLCWSESGSLIDCDGTSQDGELQDGLTTGASPRLTDNFDGTVTDNLTGLIWLRDAGCLSDTWVDALEAPGMLAHGFCGLTDGSAEGDWRLPNLNELRSLIDYGQSGPALPPGHPFFDVQSGLYWSSTTIVFDPGRAWSVFLDNGFHLDIQKQNSLRVLPVRGGP